MVTLYYIRRFLNFWADRFEHTSIQEIAISEEVKHLFGRIFSIFAENKNLLNTGFRNSDRRRITDELGKAGSLYREQIYRNAFSGKKEMIETRELLAFIKLALNYTDQSIDANKRADGLYHAYNLISFSDKDLSIRYLYEMLEGQVAVLSSGYLPVKEC